MAKYDLEPEKISMEMVKDLVNSDDIYKVKNLGKKSIREINNVLKGY